MTPAPTGRSSNPYASYVDLDAAEQPQNVYPSQPPPPAYAPPPPPVAYAPRPERARRTGLRTGLKAAGSLLALAAVIGTFQAVRTEHRQKAQACGVITASPPIGAGGPAVTREQATAVLDLPVDRSADDQQRRQDARNRSFARDLFMHPDLKAALLDIADDTEALLDARQDTTSGTDERLARVMRAGDRLVAHTRAAQEACRSSF